MNESEWNGLKDAEGRADQAESSLHLIRAKHRGSVVTGKSGGKVSEGKGEKVEG